MLERLDLATADDVLQTPCIDMADASKTVTITLRIAPDEHASWTSAAIAEDRLLSSWICRQCNAAVPTPTTTKRAKRRAR